MTTLSSYGEQLKTQLDFSLTQRTINLTEDIFKRNF